MMEDGINERVKKALESYRDPFTGKLRASEFAAAVREIAARLDVSWPAVALRIPAGIMPSRERIAAHYAQRRYPPCRGCADEECPECRKSEVELSAFPTEQLDDLLLLATSVDLSYADIMREKRRREARGIE